jgi:hypothetical protein
METCACTDCAGNVIYRPLILILVAVALVTFDVPAQRFEPLFTRHQYLFPTDLFPKQ